MAAPNVVQLWLDKASLPARSIATPDGLRLATQVRGMKTSARVALVCGVSPRQSSGQVAYELALGLIQMNCAPVLMLDLCGLESNASPFTAPANEAWVSKLSFRPDDEPTVSEAPSSPLTILRLDSGSSDSVTYLSSPEFSEFIHSARERFGFIVMSSPSVLDGVSGLIVAPLCDATVLVVGACRSKTADVQLALAQLRGVKGQVIGFVFDEAARFGA